MKHQRWLYVLALLGSVAILYFFHVPKVEPPPLPRVMIAAPVIPPTIYEAPAEFASAKAEDVDVMARVVLDGNSQSIAFSSDGKKIAWQSGGSLIVKDLKTLSPIAQIPLPNLNVSNIAWSTDDKRIFLTGRGGDSNPIFGGVGIVIASVADGKVFLLPVRFSGNAGMDYIASPIVWVSPDRVLFTARAQVLELDTLTFQGTSQGERDEGAKDGVRQHPNFEIAKSPENGAVLMLRSKLLPYEHPLARLSASGRPYIISKSMTHLALLNQGQFTLLYLGIRKTPPLAFRVPATQMALTPNEDVRMKECLETGVPVLAQVYAPIINPLNGKILGPLQDGSWHSEKSWVRLYGCLNDEWIARVSHEDELPKDGDVLANIGAWGNKPSINRAFDVRDSVWGVLKPVQPGDDAVIASAAQKPVIAIKPEAPAETPKVPEVSQAAVIPAPKPELVIPTPPRAIEPAKPAVPQTPEPVTFPMSSEKAAELQKVWAHFDKRVVSVKNSIGMQVVYIPKGEFLMGSPANESGRDENEIIHRVVISRPFAMAATHVTQAQWKAVMGTTVKELKEREGVSMWIYLPGESDDLPMYLVSWDEANEFCRRLSRREGVRYRLPTEAEWEYACRAGSDSPLGGTVDEVAWCADNSGKSRLDSQQIWDRNKAKYGEKIVENDGKTHPVGQKRPNAWGLYDMHGNLFEWCSDWFGSYPEGPAADPTGPPAGKFRCVRGGSWRDIPNYLRAAYRGQGGGEPKNYFTNIGVRPVLELP